MPPATALFDPESQAATAIKSTPHVTMGISSHVSAVTQTSPLSVVPFARVRRVLRMLLVGGKYKKADTTAAGHTQLKWEG